MTKIVFCLVGKYYYFATFTTTTTTTFTTLPIISGNIDIFVAHGSDQKRQVGG